MDTHTRTVRRVALAILNITSDKHTHDGHRIIVFKVIFSLGDIHYRDMYWWRTGGYSGSAGPCIRISPARLVLLTSGVSIVRRLNSMPPIFNWRSLPHSHTQPCYGRSRTKSCSGILLVLGVNGSVGEAKGGMPSYPSTI